MAVGSPVDVYPQASKAFERSMSVGTERTALPSIKGLVRGHSNIAITPAALLAPPANHA